MVGLGKNNQEPNRKNWELESKEPELRKSTPIRFLILWNRNSRFFRFISQPREPTKETTHQHIEPNHSLAQLTKSPTKTTNPTSQPPHVPLPTPPAPTRTASARSPTRLSAYAPIPTAPRPLATHHLQHGTRPGGQHP
jgi:hypothetical protein